MIKKILFATICLLYINSYSQTSIWNNLLQKHISNEGWVNYDSFSKDVSQLDIYLTYLNKTSINKNWSKDTKKAFWINAYNAYTIKLIIDNYPLKSILDITQNNKNAWEIPFAKIGGKTYTLNHIEHQILRKTYKDPRIHVGVNCASISCPAMPNKAFTKENINSLLDKGIKVFINNGVRNTISQDHLELSQIFNWFKDDFTQQGNLISFINKYSDVKVEKNSIITYKKYDWKLNKQ